MATIGDRLRIARKRAGFTQKELADRLTVGKRTLIRYEKGRTSPKPHVLTEVSEVTGVALEWLEKGEGEMLGPGQDNGSVERPVADAREERAYTDEELAERGLQRVPDVEVSAGSGSEPVFEEIDGEQIMPVRYIRQEFGVQPERVVRARVTGDSMKGTLDPGDRVYCATWNGGELRDGAIYVIRGPHGVQLKRLIFDQEMEDGVARDIIWVWSDNDERPRLKMSVDRFEKEYSVLAVALKKDEYL